MSKRDAVLEIGNRAWALSQTLDLANALDYQDVKQIYEDMLAFLVSPEAQNAVGLDRVRILISRTHTFLSCWKPGYKTWEAAFENQELREHLELIARSFNHPDGIRRV